MLVLEYNRHREGVQILRFSPDGSSLLASTHNGESKCGLRLWPDLRGSQFQDFPEARYAEFACRGRKLMFRDSSWRLHLSDLREGALEQIYPREGEPGQCDGFFISPDGSRFLAVENTNSPYKPAQARITYQRIDTPTGGAAIWTNNIARNVFLWPALLPKGRFLVTERWWDDVDGVEVGHHVAVTRSCRTGRILSGTVAPPLCAGASVNECPVSPDGSRIAHSGGALVVVSSVRDRSIPDIHLYCDSRKQFTALAFHPSGKFLAVTSNDATVKLYDTTTWQVARTFTWKIGKLQSIAFSPNGTLAAAGSDTGKVVVWDVDV
jgi:WD40 repeat protein